VRAIIARRSTYAEDEGASGRLVGQYEVIKTEGTPSLPSPANQVRETLV